ncbi:MAG: hypothetical protein ACTSU5_22510 [Promethearchaeota archaeon]
MAPTAPRISFVLYPEDRVEWDDFMRGAGIRTYARLVRDAVREYISSYRRRAEVEGEMGVTLAALSRTLKKIRKEQEALSLQARIPARPVTSPSVVSSRLLALFETIEGFLKEAAARAVEAGGGGHGSHRVKLTIRKMFEVTGFTRREILAGLQLLEREGFIKREGEAWGLA